MEDISKSFGQFQAIKDLSFAVQEGALFGFLGDLSHTAMDWKLLLMVTALAVAGIFLGNRISHKISGEKLKKGFGWFVLVMGLYIIVKELFL